MSSQRSPGEPPPEVPEEFADAYRSAYEQALAEQSAVGRHVESERDEEDAESTAGGSDWADRLPRRRRTLAGGARRDDATEEDPGPASHEKAWHQHRWFVPVLLTLIALLLVLGAFALGRVLAESADGDASGAVVTGGVTPAAG